MSTWEYTYDVHGNRTGLIEVQAQDDIDDVPAITPPNHWYSDIEQEIERRVSSSAYRYHITPMERAIAKAECDVLTQTPKRGANRATYPSVVEHWYTLPSGKTGVERSYEETHDTEYIANRIQQIVGSYGVRTMTHADIYDILGVVSACYESADIRGLDKPLLTFTIHDKLRKAG